MIENHTENQSEQGSTTAQDEAEYSAQERRKQVKIDRILDQAGGVGRFQFLAFLFIASGISCISFIWFGMPLYTKQPVYSCTWASSTPENPEEVCVATNICSADPRIASWQIDWSDQDSIHNWRSMPGLMCASKVQIGLIGAFYFIGWAATTTWMPRFADLYGRKNLFKIS